ncbi:Na+/H+ antiporter NhaC [Bowmanella dokdonensis]|uniref:Na+/H+ antiporter NhaC n=1 Tax=Bowmanella dokdonensis TaxID=751969 RepID=A0A939ISF8_9ALTE|nr:Na+/H+ antiporter NhaC [Bowmanella dokdonensis]MBN7827144.1 Na+/H+ antiporter NhaC [Bowmanella dokdonensis]
MSQPRQPSLLQALLPIIALLLLLFMAVYYFGDDSSSGPNQIALLLCAGVVTLIGQHNGYGREQIEQAIVRGISLTLGAILILLAVGSLIGTWLLSGTVPTMVFYGLTLLNPDYFYLSCSIICAIVALSIGSSWTVAATIGVALMGVASGLGLSEVICAGAIVSGAYFGDKLSPLSDTTNLAPAVAGADLFTHIRFMLYSTLPSYALTLVLFLSLGLQDRQDGQPTQLEALLNSLSGQFHIAWYLLLPLAITLFLAFRKMPAFPAIGIGAVSGAIMAVLFQQDFIQAQAAPDLGKLGGTITVVWQAMFAGVSLDTPDPLLKDLLSGGGMGSMLNTIWLIISAMTFGSVMEATGLLQRIVETLLKMAKSASGLVITTIGTAFGTNLVAADQYIAIVMPGRMFKPEYDKRNLTPENLSRAVEDGGTCTSALIPWNTCGAYMQSVLLVNPLDYAVYAFFNWLTPLMGILLALLGVKRTYASVSNLENNSKGQAVENGR